jgi:hypothetical protein
MDALFIEREITLSKLYEALLQVSRLRPYNEAMLQERLVQDLGS